MIGRVAPGLPVRGEDVHGAEQPPVLLRRAVVDLLGELPGQFGVPGGARDAEHGAADLAGAQTAGGGGRQGDHAHLAGQFPGEDLQAGGAPVGAEHGDVEAFDEAAIEGRLPVAQGGGHLPGAGFGDQRNHPEHGLHRRLVVHAQLAVGAENTAATLHQKDLERPGVAVLDLQQVALLRNDQAVQFTEVVVPGGQVFHAQAALRQVGVDDVGAIGQHHRMDVVGQPEDGPPVGVGGQGVDAGYASMMPSRSM